MIWYLQRVGLLEAAKAHHPWVHRYRGEVLYESMPYVQARDLITRESSQAWMYVKVARDPIRRCVSSYRHALKHGYENERMSQALGRDINHVKGFSFETFLGYLRSIDLHDCDIHHRVQKHALDTVDFGRTRLINVDEEDLEAALAAIDRKQGRDAVEAARERSDFVERAAERHAPASEEPRRDELWRVPLSASDVVNWPAASLRQSPEACSIIRHIYACDYAMLRTLARKARPA